MSERYHADDFRTNEVKLKDGDSIRYPELRTTFVIVATDDIDAKPWLYRRGWHFAQFWRGIWWVMRINPWALPRFIWTYWD
jgi:hypothetical protein